MNAESRTVAPLVRMRGITKRFGPVTVLEEVDLELFGGEVHILAGENGAGKSTLINVLGGVHREFSGRIEIGDLPVRPRGPLHANELGVAVIHQELSLVGPMSVADNILLGRMPTRAGLVRRAGQIESARRWVGLLGLDLDVARPVESFPLATRQMVEIAKALSRDARVIVMDEPTSALNAPEADRLFGLIGQLKAQGRAVVYITHRMEEIERIADRITVLRDGRRVGSAPAAEVPAGRLIRWMVGREIDDQFPRHAPCPGGRRLHVEEFSVRPRGRATAVHDVSLSVRAGEIVGIGGLQGSGASELLLGLFGAAGRRSSGRVLLDGRPVRIRSPRQAIRAGVGLVTNDRKASGLVPGASVVFNTTLAALPELSSGGWRRPARERRAAGERARDLNLRAASLETKVGELSGGNQQKVVLAKWLQTRPRLLLLDEPTRGIDIGSKREIYARINEWTRAGIAILLITSEMPELLALSDRVVVMHRGRITAEFAAGRATPEGILEAAMGRSANQPGCGHD